MQIELEKMEGVLSVPESTLEFIKEESYVYTKQEDGTYKQVKVTTGLSDGVNIEIKNGVKEGDVVRGPRIIEDENAEQTSAEQAESEETTENKE